MLPRRIRLRDEFNFLVSLFASGFDVFCPLPNLRLHCYVCDMLLLWERKLEVRLWKGAFREQRVDLWGSRIICHVSIECDFREHLDPILCVWFEVDFWMYSGIGCVSEGMSATFRNGSS